MAAKMDAIEQMIAEAKKKSGTKVSDTTDSTWTAWSGDLENSTKETINETYDKRYLQIHQDS